MARHGRDAAKERFWRAVVRRQGRSGLTVRGFCLREGLSEPGFHWWRRELARRSVTPTVRNQRPATRMPRRRRDSAARFLPISVVPGSAGPAYEVILPSGARVFVHASAGEKLADVLAALERPVC